MRKQLYTLSVLCLCFYHSEAQLGSETVASLPAMVKTESIEVEETNNDNAISFNLVGGLIIVDAQTDGTTKHCILDTGAPTLVLNQKIKSNYRNSSYAVGLAGVASARDVDIDYFRMGTITNSKLDAFATDISHLERIKNTKIDGLIGYEVLKNSHILLDYPNRQLQILSPGERHTVKDKKEVLAIPFKKRGHMPVIEIEIGNKKLRMGIDTGSEANLLDLRYKRKFRKLFSENLNKRYVRGVDQSTLISYSAKIDGASVQGMAMQEMEYLFMDMTFLNSGFGRRMDGILGYPFLKSNLVSIDFGKQVVYLYKDLLIDELKKSINAPELVMQEE